MTDLKFPDYFKPSEFECRCGCKANAMEQSFLNRLGMLRTAYNAPLIITSGFRCKPYNEKIKGSKNSQHCLGRAADIAVAEANKRYKLVACAMQLGFTIGIDGAFVHVDSRDAEKLLFLYPG